MTSLGDCRNPDCRRPLRPRNNGCGYDGAQGYCKACYYRWLRAGRPAAGPPPPLTPAAAAAKAAQARHEQREARLEDYGWLRFEIGEARTAAAPRVGVSVWTAAYVYEPEIRQRERTAA